MVDVISSRPKFKRGRVCAIRDYPTGCGMLAPKADSTKGQEEVLALEADSTKTKGGEEAAGCLVLKRYRPPMIRKGITVMRDFPPMLNAPSSAMAHEQDDLSSVVDFNDPFETNTVDLPACMDYVKEFNLSGDKQCQDEESSSLVVFGDEQCQALLFEVDKESKEALMEVNNSQAVVGIGSVIVDEKELRIARDQVKEVLHLFQEEYQKFYQHLTCEINESGSTRINV